MTGKASDRRRARRFTLLFPMQYDTSGEPRSYAISRNISESGLLMVTGEKLEAGEVVKVSLQLPGQHGEPRVLAGRIVRVTGNDADPEGIWPYLAAVEFENADESLLPLLEQAATSS